MDAPKDIFFYWDEKGYDEDPTHFAKACIWTLLKSGSTTTWRKWGMLLETGQAHMDIFVPVPNRQQGRGHSLEIRT
jgi:hypothetical protein